MKFEIRNSKFALRILVFCTLVLGSWSFAAPAVIYTNNFESAALDKVPDDMLVLDGAFAVKQDNGNKFLELPGAPLDTFGLLFGSTTNANVTVTAKIYGTGKGRRFPTFGVGLNGAGGYKVKIAPSKNVLELYKGDDVIATAPFKWKSATWTNIKMQVRAEGSDRWVIEGKAWEALAAEPQKWDLSFTEKTPPSPGRASITGSPYSGQPILFDDLGLSPIAPR